ncbi:peptidoglycan DD-metalloendopeptidase family protein [Dokdonella sp.]|uniref:peptidoglycan DD-metalloendopeptidase family protein n=1 Tax=Dokdonella sp. TaxID=2291710 RepID=UPI002B8B1D84|nr:peptidoglycan DD-metalloendopeptidase family protein [Dokdonella sp.]HOX72662.1 peptidoglycan DD-metalloendopeptidase family protein [Dokdonella sp.]
MSVRPVSMIAMLVASGVLHAQSLTGTTWDLFGPDRASGAFVNITRQHLINEYAQGIAVDHRQRVLVLNAWRESGNSNTDCAVTRHINNARLLDMSYTGPDDLEATRRVAADMGGINADTCTSIDVDASDKAVISGWGTRDGGLSGFVVRLNATGSYDTTFSTDGKLSLSNLAPFLDLNTWANHVVSVDDKVLTCGWVDRGASRNMLIVRLTSAGQLDTSFSSDGYVEVDFNVGNGIRNDSCSRLVVLPGGNIIAGGIITDGNGDRAYGFARFTSTGGFVSSFGNSGRLIIDDGSSLATTPSLVDLGWDAGRNRLIAACNNDFSALTDAGCLLAIGNTGTLDTNFDGDGRKGFRFSDYGAGTRASGATRLGRVKVRDDGGIYVMGTHYNTDAGDLAANGESDIAILRFEANGSVVESGDNAFAGDGITFRSLGEVTQRVSESGYLRVSEELVDATWYKGNLLFIADRARYQSGQFDHDGDGNFNEEGPIAPVVASIVSESLFTADFDFDGIDGFLAGVPQITQPIGYGNYCSVRNPANGSFGLLPQGTGSDPCQQFLDDNPNLVVERSGLYSLSGVNWVIGTCSGGFVTLRPGTGAQPFDAAFNDAAGRSNCIFTATPVDLQIFSQPYSGTNSGIGNTQSFNHDPYNIPMDVSDFGQTPGPFNACAIDNRGRQRSIGNPNENPSTCDYDNSGVNEPAMDIDVTSPRLAAAVAPGRVVMAVPRHVPTYTPAGNDPYQREVFIRHQVGSGRYAEIFTTYSAHMQNTYVRRGELVDTGDWLGSIGNTGASYGEHLHLTVVRNTNLSFRKSFEVNFVGGQHDRDGSVGAVDPFGWSPANGLNGVDPWAWRFRNHANNPLLDNAGGFSSRMWLPGEAPPLN